MQFYERLLRERQRLELTQDEMAKAGGVAKRTYCNYEAGDRMPDSTALAAWADAGVDIHYVVTGVRSVETLASEEVELINYWRGAPEPGRLAAMAALKAYQISQNTKSSLVELIDKEKQEANAKWDDSINQYQEDVAVITKVDGLIKPKVKRKYNHVAKNSHTEDD